MTDLSTENLADLIAKRHHCLRQLDELGERQASLIESSDMTTLLKLISAKDQVIAALQAIESQLAPFHDQDPEARDWPSPERRAECAAQAAACQQLLQRIMARERSNEDLLTRKRDLVAQQLQSAQSAGAARGAYQAQANIKPQSPHVSFSNDTSSASLDIRSEV